MDSLVRDKTSQERKNDGHEHPGKWKSDRELQRAPEVDGVETITVGKATWGFWPDGQNKGYIEPHSVELLAQRMGSGGDALLCSELKGEYNKERRASSYR